MNWTELASTDQQQVDQVTWRSRVRQLHDLIGRGETRTVGARWVLDTCWHVFQCGCLQQLRSPTGVRSSSVLRTSLKITDSTRGNVLFWEYRSPRKRNSRPLASVILCWVSWVENVLLIYYASSDLLVCLHWKMVCYSRESFARDYVITGVGLSVCLFVCLFVTTITK